MMYSLRNFFTHRPVEVTAFVMGWVNFLIVRGVIVMDEVGTGALNMALFTTFGMFIKANTTTNAGMEELKASEKKARDEGFKEALPLGNTEAIADAMKEAVEALPLPVPVDVVETPPDPPKPKPRARRPQKPKPPAV